MNDILALSMPWWSFALRGAVTYLGLLILMRLAGKRSFGEMSAFDVIVIALAGGTLRPAIIGDDTGMLGPFIGVAAILATDKAIAFVSARSPAFNRLMEGFPTLLIRKGERDPGALKEQNLPGAALDRALHAGGIETDDDVDTARLEPNGKITLIRKNK
ncbi:uncharacterized membrane protein YcaP (DUF421 family) [Luteibacter sp. HA06]